MIHAGRTVDPGGEGPLGPGDGAAIPEDRAQSSGPEVNNQRRAGTAVSREESE